ncbi:hypothetical protein BCR44DRAFT_73304 [Catenaria anguillulae PL171]|uniref:TmcB/TmcC TPR repeats domain-containing protein n=1 Tax=Catenaria anguillulae PL171 TaxID=765915 RepID=A0A1Y2HPA1_9FUNG|nr:hypothetical protein BCR44DRAFT_73304 [Catenaria anguillulae PL171]
MGGIDFRSSNPPSANANNPTTLNANSGNGGGGGLSGIIANQLADYKSVTSGKRADLRALLPTTMWEKTLFQIAYLTTRDTDFPPTLSWALTVIEDLLWFSFPFTANLHPSLPPLLVSLIDSYAVLSDYVWFKIANAVVIATIFFTTALVGGVVVSMHRRINVPIYVLRLLRLLCALIMTALSIPFATILFMGLNCFSKGELPLMGVKCVSVEHIPFLVLSPIAIVIFLVMVVVGALTFIDSSPTSTNPLAKAHGRLDAQAAMLRLLFVLLKVNVAGREGTPTWFYIVITTFGLMYHAQSLLTSPPYFDMKMNQFRVGMCAGAGSAMLTTFILHLTIGPDTGIWWTLMLPAAALGVWIGFYATHIYVKQYLKRTVRLWHRIVKEETLSVIGGESTITTPNQSTGAAVNKPPSVAGGSVTRTANTGLSFSVKSPSFTRTGAGSDNNLNSSGGNLPAADPSSPPTAGGGAVYGRESTISTQVMSSLSRGMQRARTTSNSAALNSAVDGVHASMSRQGSRTNAAAGRANTSQSNLEDASNINNLLKATSLDLLTAVMERQPKRRMHVFDSPAQVEISIRFIRENPTQRQISLGLQLLERGLLEFPRNSQLLLLAASYLSSYYGVEGERAAEQVIQVLQTGKIAVPMDVRFLIFCRERSLRAQGVHVLDTAAVDTLMREVRSLHLKSLYSVRDAWEAIRTGASANVLADVVARLAEYQSGADACYRKLLDKNQHDRQLLRLYSQYLMWVCADQVRAAQILEHADELEINESRHPMGAIRGHQSSFERPILGNESSPFSMASAMPPSVMGSGIVKASAILEGGDASPGESNEVVNSEHDDHAPIKERITLNDVGPQTGSGHTGKEGSRAKSSMLVPINQVAFYTRKSMEKLVSAAKSKKEGGAVGGGSILYTREKQGDAHACNKMHDSPSQSLEPSLHHLHHPGGKHQHDGHQVPSANISRNNSETGPHGMGYSASDTSGTSASRAMRRKMAKRRLLAERVASPLNRVGYFNFSAALFAISVCVGFFLCMSLFVSTTRFLNGEFETARNARRACRAAAESVRFMVHSNLVGSRTNFASAVRDANSSVAELMTQQIPVLTRYYGSLAIEVPKFRLYLRLVSNDTIDYSGIDVSPLEAVVRIAQMTTLALGFNYGELRPEVVNRMPDLSWLVENMSDVFFTVRQLSYVLVDSYKATLQWNTIYLTICAVTSGVLLIVCVWVCYKSVFQRYFSGEATVHALLGQVNRRSAANLVTTLEEEIELFREVIDLEGEEGLEDASDLKFSSGIADDKAVRYHRKHKYLSLLLWCAVIFGVLIGSMYAITITSLNREADLKRMVYSTDRRNLASLLRIYSREWTQTLATDIPKTTLVRYMRGVITDISFIHESLVNDPGGLSDMLPELTVLPRSCAAASSCTAAINRPEIGYTRAMSELPLNTAMYRLIETAIEVTNAMTVTGSHVGFASSPAAPKLELMLAISSDLTSRLSALDVGIQKILNDRVIASSFICVVVFVVFVVLLVVAMGALFWIALRKLRREARALTTLLYLLPQQILTQSPELSTFIESGGLTLRTSRSSELNA